MYIKELSKKASDAEGYVKDIAMKAIESSSKFQVFEADGQITNQGSVN